MVLGLAEGALEGILVTADWAPAYAGEGASEGASEGANEGARVCPITDGAKVVGGTDGTGMGAKDGRGVAADGARVGVAVSAAPPVAPEITWSREVLRAAAVRVANSARLATRLGMVRGDELVEATVNVTRMAVLMGADCRVGWM